MDYPAFVGGTAKGELITVAGERSVNCYPSVQESEGARKRMELLPTPGVRPFATGPLPTAIGRALFTDPVTGRCFALQGSVFYEVLGGGTLVARGIVDADIDEPGTISSNGAGGGQLFVTSGGKGYLFTLATDVFLEVVSSDCHVGAMLDGFFLYLDRTNSAYFISEPLDGATWDPLQFRQRSSEPDPWVSLQVVNRDIWLIGTETSEVHFNTGASPFPFAQHDSGVIPWGTAAAWSPTVLGDAIVWLGQSKTGKGSQVLAATGFQPVVISDSTASVALEELRAANQLDDAIGDTFEHQGHTFYVLTFLQADVTSMAYDFQTRKWLELGTWDTTEGKFHAWRSLYHATAFGKHLVCDRLSAVINEMGRQFGLDAGGGPIVRIREAPVLGFEFANVVYPAFELDVEVGVGTATGDGSDPKVTLHYSNDGGFTWIAAGDRQIGPLGRHGRRVRWLRCGAGRRRKFRTTFNDPVPWRVAGASLPRVHRGAA